MLVKYKIAHFIEKLSRLFEIARLFVRFDHVARGIIKRVLRDPERGPWFNHQGQAHILRLR